MSGRRRHPCGIMPPAPPPIPDRLRDMRAEDVGAARQIGDGAGHAQDAVHRARGELEQVDRVFEYRLSWVLA